MDDWRVKLNEYLGIEPGKGRGNKNKVNVSGSAQRGGHNEVGTVR